MRRPQRNIKPSRRRVMADALGHRPPASGRDHTGRPWRGASRVLDRPARRKSNRRSWLRLKAEARRAYVASARAASS